MPNPHVTIRVDCAAPLGAWQPIWNWFGHDEPNYTTMPHGRKLLRGLAALHSGPVHVRVHNLLTSGDGAPALKWGSTNAYTEDASGRPVHSWALLDQIFDAYVELGISPFVQVGFMPEALSTGPAPYRHDFPRGEITTGWAWPPRDFARWAELVEAWMRHARERYGAKRASEWFWEIWNEPDGLYWKGSIESFCRLHDLAADAIRRVLPEARVGGPHTCGPTTPRAAPARPRCVPRTPIAMPPLYGAYVVEALARTMELSEKMGVKIDGSVTWAFEFEGEPLFAGLRELATNGIDKAVLNAFRMLAMLKGERVATQSSRALTLAEVVADGVRGAADVNAIATRDGAEAAILIWHYHDDDVASPDASIVLTVNGLGGASCEVEQFQMDASHGNAYAVWREMGSPRSPSKEQYARLEALSRLPYKEPPIRREGVGDVLELAFTLPRQGVALFRLRGAA
jgi:hypothetical protein